MVGLEGILWDKVKQGDLVQLIPKRKKARIIAGFVQEVGYSMVVLSTERELDLVPAPDITSSQQYNLNLFSKYKVLNKYKGNLFFCDKEIIEK